MDRRNTNITTLIVFFLFSFSGFCYVWHIDTIEQNIQHQQNTNVDLVVDDNSIPHLTYFSKFNGDSDISLAYAYWSGIEWVKDKIIPDYFPEIGSPYYRACIDVDCNGVIFVAYFNHEDEGVYFKYKDEQGWSTPYLVDYYGTFELYDMRVDSNSLLHIVYRRILPGDTIDESALVVAIGSESDFDKYIIEPNSNFSWASLAIDSNGHDHVAYYDTNDVTVLKYVSDHNWLDVQQIESLGGREISTLSIDTDMNNVPHISYYHVNDANLKYATRSDSNWITETPDSSGITGKYSGLTIDANGSPHIFYYDNTNGVGKAKYAVHLDTGWQIKTVGIINESPEYFSADIDNSGYAHVVYNVPLSYTVEYAMPAICGSSFNPFPEADIDKNCSVDMYDLALLGKQWTQSPCVSPGYCDGADLDKLGSVDMNDLDMINNNWLDCSMPVCD